MTTPLREFHLCITGASNVGKTSICERLIGKTFARKPSKPSLEDEATKYSIEVNTSTGLLLFHIYDWAWEVKRRDESINQQLMRGNDAGIFVYDVTDRRTYRDFVEYSDWYQRAAGFDKPWLCVSNKNDQKKKIVQDAEGQALARAGDRRSYVGVSLVDDTGFDEFVLSLARLMMQDLNLSVSSFGPASEESMKWADERAAARISSIGLGSAVDKSKRVLLLVLNRSIGDKFIESSTGSEFLVDTVGSLEEIEEEFAAPSSSLPIFALACPPSATDRQQQALREAALKFNVGAVVSIPRNIITALREV